MSVDPKPYVEIIARGDEGSEKQYLAIAVLVELKPTEIALAGGDERMTKSAFADVMDRVNAQTKAAIVEAVGHQVEGL